MNFTKISVVIPNSTDVPYFIGSQIRGALGYALKKVVCINPSYDCVDCFASGNCLFYEFYEAKNDVHKYRLDFEMGRSYYDFDIYLFDDACNKIAYIVSAIYTLLTKNGIGRNNRVYEDIEIYINDIPILKNHKITMPTDFIKIFEVGNIKNDIVLHFNTPLRIKKNNSFIRDSNIELDDIINSIYQRQMRLLGRDYKRFAYKIAGEIISKDLNYKELTRKSNRQRTMMNIGGIVGSISIRGLDEKSYSILKLGELIGVGKQTVFGLGSFKIEEMG